MKHCILLSTTTAWNCGDDFIRYGLLTMLRLRPEVCTLWHNRAPNADTTHANDTGLSLAAADCIIFAGTPEWTGRNERLWDYAIEHHTPVALIGIGDRGQGWVKKDARNERLVKAAKAGIIEVAITRDRAALDFLANHGIPSVQMPDPAFFMPRLPPRIRRACLGWRGYGRGNVRGRMVEIWHDLCENRPKHYAPPRVIVHELREVAAAAKYFGKGNVYYSSNWREMLGYLREVDRYIGERIHGAVATLVNGGEATLIYGELKGDMLKETFGGIPVWDCRKPLPDAAVLLQPGKRVSGEVLDCARDEMRRVLKATPILGGMMED